MIVSWPQRITTHCVRTQDSHAVDIVPTLNECIGIEPPETLTGYPQLPLEGISFAASFDVAGAQTVKQTQFYSMGGTRAIWHDGWKAAALSPAAPTREPTTRPWSGSCSTHGSTPASVTTSLQSTRRSCRSSSHCGGPRLANTTPLPP
jgi:arylsulfatase A-like enzyme